MPDNDNDPLLGSMATTDRSKVPNPADYDEELADAKLVEKGLGDAVPGTTPDAVETMGETVLAQTTGTAAASKMGGTGDLQAVLGDTVTGDPDNPDAVDDSDVPEGYAMDEEE